MFCCFLFVSDVPDAPVDLGMSEQKARSVRLSWTAGSDRNSSITGTTGQIKVSYFSQQELTATAREQVQLVKIKDSSCTAGSDLQSL